MKGLDNRQDISTEKRQHGVMLVNLGTPRSPETPDVRRYLREFLSDPRVIDISPVGRWMLLNFIILPFRPRMTSEAYKKIWTKRGSPLYFHGIDLTRKLAQLLGDQVRVELAMRYQEPSILQALRSFSEADIDRIIVIPLFPQYSSAAWGSAVEKVQEEANKLWNMPSIQVIPPFYDHPAFIESHAAIAKPVLANASPERVMMSFHGLPERHVIKSDLDGAHCLQSANCCACIAPANRYCYRAQCFATARALAVRLGLAEDEYEVTFQSRLGRSPWIKPYTDIRVRELAVQGVKRLAILSPSFVADCLETIEELGIRAREDFLAHGGDDLTLVPSLNADDRWAQALVQIIHDAWPAMKSVHPEPMPV